MRHHCASNINILNLKIDLKTQVYGRGITCFNLKASIFNETRVNAMSLFYVHFLDNKPSFRKEYVSIFGLRIKLRRHRKQYK
jgi:hypothetical protein